MIKKIIFIFIFLSSTSVFAQNNIIIIDNNKSSYKIIISTHANDFEKKASTIFQTYIKKISGIELPITTDDAKVEVSEIVIGNTNRCTNLEFKDLNQTLKSDGYFIKTIGNKLFILGGTGKGVVYGVVSFLEDYLGCRKYSPTVEVIPALKEIRIGNINDKQVPSAFIRIINGNFAADEGYKDWRKLNTIKDNWESGNVGGGYYVHTFSKLVPSEEYFETHPEYFSLVDGKRIFNGQLCLTNSDVLKITIERLRKLMSQSPHIKYWSVSQNDHELNCQCLNCKAIDDEQGSPSGSLLSFVNKVAAEFPDKIITTLAYTYTRKPPLKIKPADNVMITLCTIELNRGEAIETDPTSSSFRNEIIGWSKICKKIMLWDYEVQFTNYLCPFPLFHTLQPNIKFFTKYNVVGHFQQCNAVHGVEFAELKSYLLSKLLWNPNANGDSIINDFMTGYYQEAGKYIRQYFDLIHSECIKSKSSLEVYGNPVMYSQSFLSQENLVRYNEIFDKAEEAVKDKPTILERVKIDRLPIQFAQLEIARSDLFGERGWFKLENNKYAPKKEMNEILEQLYKVCTKNDIIYLNEKERGVTKDTYYQNALQSIRSGIENNLAFQKEVRCEPLPDKKYFCNGPKSLTNGSLGTNDFMVNWLGWEAQDFEIIIDLGKLSKVKATTIRTLQMPYSWIMHPLEIVCLFSKDGKNFIEQQIIKSSEDLRTETEFKNFKFSLSPQETQYIKFKIIGSKQLPAWHNYAGRKPWVFVDEITAE